MNDNRSGGEGLQRKLSPLNVWALALGSIIGWGAFVMPANTFLPNAGPLGTLIAMAAGAIIMVVIALNYSYMINHFPVAGGANSPLPMPRLGPPAVFCARGSWVFPILPSCP